MKNIYDGPSEITKSNHMNMPSRNAAYLETDERGHIQASSLGGNNSRNNVVPQSADLNHGGYYSMEKGERAVLQSSGAIQSEKIAFSSVQPGNRPDAFMVNDTITYGNEVQTVHLSFANMTNAEQVNANEIVLTQGSDLLGDPQANIEDDLRTSMSSMEYTDLMQETDMALPNIDEMYDIDVYTSYVAPEVDTQLEVDSTDVAVDSIDDLEASIDED